jgi:hypothetical protein
MIHSIFVLSFETQLIDSLSLTFCAIDPPAPSGSLLNRNSSCFYAQCAALFTSVVSCVDSLAPFLAGTHISLCLFGHPTHKE